jgi:hypothetical protein
MGKFSGVSGARVGGGGVYFLAGQYKVKVKKVFLMASRKREDLFIVETEILESDNEKRKVGMSCSWVVKMSQDAALGNIKGFVAACMGEDAEDENIDWESECECAVDDENPLAGTEVDLECVDITTRDGNPFTLHKWSTAA